MCDVRSTTVQQPDRVPLLWILLILVSLWHILSDRCAMCVICVKLTTELFKRWPVVRFAARNPDACQCARNPKCAHDPDCLSVRTKPKVQTASSKMTGSRRQEEVRGLRRSEKRERAEEQNDAFPLVDRRRRALRSEDAEES